MNSMACIKLGLRSTAAPLCRTTPNLSIRLSTSMSRIQVIKSFCSNPNGDFGNSVAGGYLALPDDQLMKQCEMETFKASGPGGQHRNKRESAVRLKHLPTGITAQAVEDRSQHKNRASALARLRIQLALAANSTVKGSEYGSQIKANNPKFAAGMQALLDLMYAVEGSVSDAAKLLGLSTGALSRMILSDVQLRLAANDIRASKGLKPLK